MLRTKMSGKECEQNIPMNMDLQKLVRTEGYLTTSCKSDAAATDLSPTTMTIENDESASDHYKDKKDKYGSMKSVMVPENPIDMVKGRKRKECQYEAMGNPHIQNGQFEAPEIPEKKCHFETMGIQKIKKCRSKAMGISQFPSDNKEYRKREIADVNTQEANVQKHGAKFPIWKVTHEQNSNKAEDERQHFVPSALSDFDVSGKNLSSHTVALSNTSSFSKEIGKSSNSSEDEMDEYERMQAVSNLSTSMNKSSRSVDRSKSSDSMTSPQSIISTRSVHVRTKYTTEDVRVLQRAFDENPYPEMSVVDSLSQELNVPNDRIKVWFQNKRHRSRRKAFMTSIVGQTPYLSPFMPFNVGAVPVGMYPNIPEHYLTYHNLLPHFHMPHYHPFYHMRCHSSDNRNILQMINDE